MLALLKLRSFALFCIFLHPSAFRTTASRRPPRYSSHLCPPKSCLRYLLYDFFTEGFWALFFCKTTGMGQPTSVKTPLQIWTATWARNYHITWCPKCLFSRLPRHHVQEQILAFFWLKFGQQRSHHVMDAACCFRRKEAQSTPPKSHIATVLVGRHRSDE